MAGKKNAPPKRQMALRSKVMKKAVAKKRVPRRSSRISPPQPQQSPRNRRRSSTRNSPAQPQESRNRLGGVGMPEVAAARRRSHAGQAALREIRKYQSRVDVLIPKLSFQRLCRETVADITGFGDLRFQTATLGALQEASEIFVIEVLGDALLCTIHAKRVTLLQRDLQLAMRLRGFSDMNKKQCGGA